MLVLWVILAVITTFLIVILFHECGHYIAAKITKVRVNQITLGFGPTLFSFGQFQQTQIRIGLIPAGGAVQLHGVNEPSTDFDSLSNKSALQRAFVYLAGPLANFLLALVIYSLMFSVGAYKDTLIIESVKNGSIADHAGLKRGDKILSIDKMAVRTKEGFYYGLLKRKGDAGHLSLHTQSGYFETQLQADSFNGGIIDKFGVSFAKQESSRAIVESLYSGTILVVRMVQISCESILSLFQPSHRIRVESTQTNPRTASTIEKDQFTIVNVFRYMAYISIIIGLFNLLPLPFLDGSHIILCLFEGLSGRVLLPKTKIVLFKFWLAALVMLGLGYLILLNS